MLAVGAAIRHDWYNINKIFSRMYGMELNERRECEEMKRERESKNAELFKIDFKYNFEFFH